MQGDFVPGSAPDVNTENQSDPSILDVAELSRRGYPGGYIQSMTAEEIRWHLAAPAPHTNPRDVRLIQNDYQPVAEHDKRPVAKGWNSRGWVTAGRVWYDRNNSIVWGGGGTAVCTGGSGVIAADIDTPKATDGTDHTSAIVDVVTEALGENPYPRYGSKGRAYLYYAPESFCTMTVKGVHPTLKMVKDGAEVSLVAGVEIIGDAASTGNYQKISISQPLPGGSDYYRWPNGSPYEIPLRHLPPITEERAKAAIEAVAARMAELGYQQIKVRPKPYNPAAYQYQDGGDPDFDPVAYAEGEMERGVGNWADLPAPGARSHLSYWAGCRLSEIGVPLETAIDMLREWGDPSPQLEEHVNRAYSANEAKFGTWRPRPLSAIFANQVAAFTAAAMLPPRSTASPAMNRQGRQLRKHHRQLGAELARQWR